MNTARIVVLVIALAAGGVAAYLASGYQNAPAPVEAVKKASKAKAKKADAAEPAAEKEEAE